MKWVLVIGALLFVGGCSSLPAALTAATQGAQWIGSLIDVAESGSQVYFARHPSMDAQGKVNVAVQRARTALAALDHALAAAEGAQNEDVGEARREALAAYQELRALLEDLGVLTAKPPAGGAETEAPLPEPVALPTVEEVAGVLHDAP